MQITNANEKKGPLGSGPDLYQRPPGGPRTGEVTTISYWDLKTLHKYTVGIDGLGRRPIRVADEYLPSKAQQTIPVTQ